MAAEIGHHQIVENAPEIMGELGVALPSRRNAENILRHQPFQRQRGILEPAGFRAQRDLAHMRDVEQAGRRAGMQVFPEHAGCELHRHLIAGERHHLAAAGRVQRVQRGGFQRGMVVARKHHWALVVPGDQFPGKPIEAPSVAVPESIIPSADTSGP